MPELPLRYRFIYICRDTSDQTWNNRPVYLICNNKSGTCLGRILYYSPWRQFVANFRDDAVFNNACLNDIIDAIGKLTNLKES
jgi:hypothetical protein